MEPPPAELTFICIDNSERVRWYHQSFHAQLDAIKFYCETLFESNPNSVVCLYRMASCNVPFGPTRDLKQISKHLQDLPCEGDVWFEYALACACAILSLSPIHMKRRILMFVASHIDLQSSNAVFCGRKLKERGIALNVFNFFLLKSKTDKYHYLRDHIDTLVSVVNHNGNSCLRDVHESRICDMLSKSILKENLHYLSEMTRNEKNGALFKINKNRASAEVECSEISEILGMKKKFGPIFEFPRGHIGKPKSTVDSEYGNLSVKITCISVTRFNQAKAEKDVSVKQELELSCTEKNKAAAQGIYVEPNLGWFHKEKTKSAADTSEKRAGEGKNRKKILYVQRGSELSCNEKNQAAAEYGKYSPLLSLEGM